MCNWEGVEYLKRDKSSVCPKCYSRERHRSIYRYLTDYNLLKGNTCLDIASRGIFQRRLNYVKYYNIDKYAGRASLLMDVCDLRFEDNSIDLIICCSVLQFVEDYKKALTEMHRVLNPDGICIIQVPYSYSTQHTRLNELKNALPQSSSCSAAEVVMFSYHDFMAVLQGKYDIKTFLFKDQSIMFSQKEIFVCNKNS